MKHSEHKISIPIKEICKGSITSFVKGSIGILTFLSILACAPTELSGKTEKKSETQNPKIPAAVIKEAQQNAVNPEIKSVSKEKVTAPADVEKSDPSIANEKPNSQPVDAVIEIEMLTLNKENYRNCLQLSINDGPIVDFGCDRSPSFVLSELDMNKRLIIKRKVKALPKRYCNKISIFSTITDKSLVSEIFDTKEANIINKTDSKKRLIVFDMANGLDNKTSINIEIGGLFKAENGGVFSVADGFNFRIETNDTMKFAIENAYGCFDKTLLSPI